jgi:hypothetical protein
MEGRPTYFNCQKSSGTEKMGPRSCAWRENGTKADGVGELWFESAEATAKAMTSPEMAAAVEDAKRFLDMTRTYALTVDETTIVA